MGFEWIKKLKLKVAILEVSLSSNLNFYTYRISHNSHMENITLYKYISSKFVESTIREGTIKVTRLNQSNDPLEFLPEGATQKLNLWRERTKNKQPIVLCLSPIITSPPMWAHYGDNHQGAAVALKFNITHSYKTSYNNEFTNEDFTIYLHRLEGGNYLVKCLYADKRPRLPRSQEELKQWNEKYGINSYTRFNISFLHLMIAKGKHWNYENEYRIIFPEDTYSTENKLVINDFKDNIRGIILGKESKFGDFKLTKAKVRKWIRESAINAKLGSIYCSSTDYSFCCDDFFDSKKSLEILEQNATSIEWDKLAEIIS